MHTRSSRLAVLSAAVLVLGTALGHAAPPRPRPSTAKVPGKVYVVAPDGSDSARGDAERPLKTIARALSLARPGDTVRLRAGTYAERVAVKVSGSEGRSITIEGERGPKGEWLSVLDQSVPLKAKWTPAPEVGAGVYKMPYPGFEPYLMLVDGKFIPRIWPDHMADGEGFQKLAYPPDQKVETYGGKQVCYWDVMGAMYGCKDGTLYIRFRDRDDPNAKDIRIAPKGGGVEIVDQSWIVLRNLFVEGGQSCILIKGPKAAHNVVEDCRLVNASERVTVEQGASYNLVRNNEITADFYSPKCQTGAWETTLTGDAIPYEIALKFLFYNQYKMFFGPNGTSDYGVRLSGGVGNEVCQNQVLKGGQGIHVGNQATDVRIHDNLVQGMSSIGIIVTLDKVVNVQVFDNLVVDSNLGCRMHHVNEQRQSGPRSVYLYRNRFWQPAGVGAGMFFHYHDKNDVEPYPHPHIYIYHNSFAGGRSGMQLSGHADRLGGLPNTLVLNNIFSTRQPVYGNSRFAAMEDGWAAFDYNWLGGSGKPAAKWCGPHNVAAAGQALWDVAKQPDFGLPKNSSARGAGLDLSKPFELRGRKYQPLPGMDRGYFKGRQPDLGAVQSK